jgi:hypothetical protein
MAGISLQARGLGTFEPPIRVTCRLTDQHRRALSTPTPFEDSERAVHFMRKPRQYGFLE